jgi:hypothetical protein
MNAGLAVQLHGETHLLFHLDGRSSCLAARLQFFCRGGEHVRTLPSRLFARARGVSVLVIQSLVE